MGQKASISDADLALANLIWNSIKDGAAAAKNIISSQEQISFTSPKAANLHGSRKLSIFLYNITEEGVARNILLAVDSSSKKTMPFALHYLVTPSTGNDKDDHVLLEEIIQGLLASPIVSSEEDKNVGLTIKIESLSLDELNKLWNALDAPLRLSISISVLSAEPKSESKRQVSAAATPQTPAFGTADVTQLYQAVLETFTEQSTGWKNRNVFFKQMMLQNFKKITDMTVDEMTAALNSLGNKLEQHGPTAQFIKPLNVLAGYYKHQLGELEGLQKLSHKQSENIETVSKWIKDIEALLEALTAAP